MRQVYGPHVYDDQSDQWYRFDTEDEAVNFAAQGETMRYVPTVREATATHFNAFQVVLNYPDVVQLVARDPSRTRLSVHYSTYTTTATSYGLLIGTREGVQSGQGWDIFNGGVPYTIETTEEIWASWFTYPGGSITKAVTRIQLWVESKVS